ncbi:MAG TPA: type II toxin-antitoxin system HicA family toxin [Dongiaceae bacterium]|nr:type II toxin-antitoxin system HicA family toxin [Dongiaceae bacterium]
MARLPVVNHRQIERVRRQVGFAAVRQKGSHVFYRHPGGRTTTVPQHKGRDIAPPLLHAILDDVGLRGCERMLDHRSCVLRDGRCAASSA